MPGSGTEAFQVTSDRFLPAIDAVIAWVDGSDPQHWAKRRRYLKPGGLLRATRFADSGEIYYCIASILKYAGFINRIWIVCDAQRPGFIDAFAKAGLCAPGFIQTIDHTALFAGIPAALPTFNSRSIEAVLWRIPELSEHFVYFNDDFFLNRPLRPADWFVEGRPVLHGRKVLPDRWLLKPRLRGLLRKLNFQTPAVRPTFRLAQERGAHHAGITGNFMLVDHHPHPMRRSVQEAFFADSPQLLREQVQHRFRDVSQYSPVALANHLEMALHGAKWNGPSKVAYIKPSSGSHGNRFADQVLGEKRPYGCVQSLDKFDPETLRQVRLLLRKKFGDFLPEGIHFTGDEKRP